MCPNEFEQYITKTEEKTKKEENEQRHTANFNILLLSETPEKSLTA